jgi:anion-transporting  ArsA/GET3 family ATPase
MAQFLAELNDLFGGFKERAGAVRAALRSAEVSFVLVTSPAPMSIQEVLFFNDRLERAAMPRGAFVVNRVRSPPPFADVVLSGDDAARAAAEHGLHLGSGAGVRLVAAHVDATHSAALDQRHLRELMGRALPIVRLPELASDIRDLEALASLAALLMAGGM